ncbi:MAG: hypothetical protein ACFNS6_00890 [Candidatus Saccharimonas sp.]
MTEFDFDELDRSITEAMSKSGLLKEDGQHAEAPTPPAVSTPSNPSSNTAPVSVEPNKLAPGPGPVANMTVSPSPAATVGVAKQPSSSVSTASVPVLTTAPAQPAVGVSTAQVQTLPTNGASASTGVSVASQASTVVQNSALNSSIPSPAPQPLPQAAIPPQVAAIGGAVPVRSGLPKKMKTKSRGRFMDIVSSQPGVNKHPASKVKYSTMPAQSLNNVSSNISGGSSQQLGPTAQRSTQYLAASSTQENVAANTNNVSSELQSSESRVFHGDSALSQASRSNSGFEDKSDYDEADDSKNEKRSYSIGGTHGRDIAPSAELVESLQKDAQDASNEIGFSQAESRANDIQSIEDASAENDEDDARIQDAPAPKKHRFMPIGGKPKPVEKTLNPPAAEAPVANVEDTSEQPEQLAEPLTNQTVDSPVQSVTTEPDPPREQTIDEIESGAIYDTSEYYTEFKDDKKHKQSRHSGLKWFLVIIVFLALGALAGAGYFFLTRY